MTSTDTAPSPTTDLDAPTRHPLQPIVDAYFDCWNTTDPDERRSKVEATWTPEARNVDPVVDATGHDALLAMFAGFHETYSGHSFRQRGGIDEHHDIARWGWEMVNPDGEVVLDGIDAAMINDGRIGYLVGFFGYDLPAA